MARPDGRKTASWWRCPSCLRATWRSPIGCALRGLLLIDLRAPVVVSGAAARLGLQVMGGIGESVPANALPHQPEVAGGAPLRTTRNRPSFNSVGIARMMIRSLSFVDSANLS